MIDLMEQTFIDVSTQLVGLIVPIIAITIAFRLFFHALYGGGRRD